jgi:hypothetical protein
MNLYSVSVALHVLTAILGLGPLTALAVVSSAAPPALSPERFGQLLRIVGWSLAVMLLTGILIIAQTHGALSRTGWVRASFALYVVLGALHGVVRREFQRSRQTSSGATGPRGLSLLLWTMCGLVGVITYLMEAKPW